MKVLTFGVNLGFTIFSSGNAKGLAWEKEAVIRPRNSVLLLVLFAVVIGLVVGTRKF